MLVLSPLLTALPSSEAHFKCSCAPSTCHTCFALCLPVCAASTCWRFLEAKGVPFFLNTLLQACLIGDLQMFVWNEGREGAPNANLLLCSFAKRPGQFPACTCVCPCQSNQEAPCRQPASPGCRFRFLQSVFTVGFGSTGPRVGPVWNLHPGVSSAFSGNWLGTGAHELLLGGQMAGGDRSQERGWQSLL